MISFTSSLDRLRHYIEEKAYVGYDPYDAMSSPSLRGLPNKYLRILATQGLVYSPINIRPLLKIIPGVNPKAHGIVLQAYCLMRQKGLIDTRLFERATGILVEDLLATNIPGFSGYCWGFNFPWQDLSWSCPHRYPTVVVTSDIATGFVDLFKLTREPRYLTIARSSCDFILKDLHHTQGRSGISISYTPFDTLQVPNASALGAGLLLKVYGHTHETELKEVATQAFNEVISQQNGDGSWNYNAHNTARSQIDFHQGFILDSLCDLTKCTQDDRLVAIVRRGAEFYLTRQFGPDGRAYWRLPFTTPNDIHHQAQGIITCCHLYETLGEKQYMDTACRIARWTIDHMQDPKGYFYYQRWGRFMNSIEYMRWGQAWMLLALAMVSTYENTL